MIEYKYRCRFKTKEEFIKEYGNNWRDIVPYHFPNAMDYLLGTDIDLETDTRIADKSVFKKNGKIHFVYFQLNYIEYYKLKISYEMIKQIQVAPSYLPKTFIYE